MILRGDFSSDILKMTTNIQVLVPENCKDQFSVVYLLHGLHGNQGTWIDRTMLPVYANDYNAVFVMPEAGRSFYSNLKYGRKYYDFVTDELPEVTKKIFNISAKRSDTAIMGCSMGGYGSLWISLTKPEQYGFCGAISPACLFFKQMLDALRQDPRPYLKTGKEAEETYMDLLCIYGEGLEYRPDYDVLEIVRNYPSDKPKPKIFVTCGTEDDLRKENLKFKEIMQATDFDYSYEEWQGGHDWYFFNDALKRTLEAWHKVKNSSFSG